MPGQRHPAEVGVGAEPVVHDRDVVSGEVPRRVHVEADRAKVRPHHRDIEDPTEVSGVDDLLHALNAGVVHEDVSDHKNARALVGQRLQLFTFSNGRRDRLLHKNVLVVFKRRLRDAVVCTGRGCNDDRVDGVVLEHLFYALGRLESWEASPNLAQA